MYYLVRNMSTLKTQKESEKVYKFTPTKSIDGPLSHWQTVGGDHHCAVKDKEEDQGNVTMFWTTRANNCLSIDGPYWWTIDWFTEGSSTWLLQNSKYDTTKRHWQSIDGSTERAADLSLDSERFYLVKKSYSKYGVMEAVDGPLFHQMSISEVVG